MRSNDFSTTNLEGYVASIVKDSGATTAVFTNRPKASVKVDDFAVVSVSGRVEDWRCYGTATVGIDFFAKDLRNFKNTRRLETMCSKFLEYLGIRASSASGDFSIDFDLSDFIGAHASSLSDFSADFNWGDFFSPTSEYIIDSHATILGDTADDYGFTARMIEIKVTIKIKE